MKAARLTRNFSLKANSRNVFAFNSRRPRAPNLKGKKENSYMLIRTRRDFLRATLRSVTALGAVGAMSKFGAMNALAQSGSGYQALVCIFLSGGNDGMAGAQVTPLTLASRAFFENPPQDFADRPLIRRRAVLTFGREDQRATLEAQFAALSPDHGRRWLAADESARSRRSCGRSRPRSGCSTRAASTSTSTSRTRPGCAGCAGPAGTC